MGERSTAGSICDTWPVEVNNKLHKKCGSAKYALQNQVVKHRFDKAFRSRQTNLPLFTT